MAGFFTRDFEARPPVFRYLYYILSGLRFRSFADWQSDGEPNPFVGRRRPRRRHTSEQEIADIFEMSASELQDFAASQSGSTPKRRRRRRA